MKDIWVMFQVLYDTVGVPSWPESKVTQEIVCSF
jgi:hypothetical protein